MLTKTTQQQQLFTIINVDAPTTTNLKHDPNILHDMYAMINNIITEVKKPDRFLYN